MRMRYAAIGLSLALVTVSPPGAGQARPPGAGQARPPGAGQGAPAPSLDADEQAAREHNLGIEAMRRGDLEGARAHFLSAWNLKKHFQIAANLGMAELRLGRRRDAAEHLSYALREGAKLGEDERRAMQAMLDEAGRSVGAASVDVSREGAEILIDGRLIGRSPLRGEVFVEPGRRVIEARLAGYAPASAAVDFDPGASRRVALTLVELPRPQARATGVAPAAPPGTGGRDEVRDGHPPLWSIGVAAGVAAAGIATGAGFTIAANGAAADADDMLDSLSGGRPNASSVCASTPAPDVAPKCAEIERARRRQDTYQDLAVAGYVVGGLTAAGAVTLAIWSAVESSGGSRIGVAPLAAPRLGGVTVHGSF
ncbi:MAG: PEGA domain-containing protein [Polyangiaceae bacterium]|nr:PEGA domain-containing protein [Polyangiaceae bacterium]